MIHQMRLFPEPFGLVKNRLKSIEVRLYDEKRKKINVGDEIIFSKLPECTEKISIRVNELFRFRSFRELYEYFPFEMFGREDKSMEWMLENTYSIYTEMEETKLGILAIRMELSVN
jgi:ASC-1-like (ASCH) protein